MNALETEVPSFGGSLAVSFLSLGLVCIAAFVLLRWVSLRGGSSGKGPIRVLARCALEPRRSVYLIEAGGKCLLVGVAEGAMTVLSELDPEKVEVAPAASGGRSFAAILARRIQKGASPVAEAAHEREGR